MAGSKIGDSEGCFEFDSNDKAHVKQALKIAGVRPKRVVSPEQAMILAARLATVQSPAYSSIPGH